MLLQKYGFHGNLDTGDIINQIIGIPQSVNVTHIVFMGMGEPMDNLENVLKACEIIISEWGLACKFKKRNSVYSRCYPCYRTVSPKIRM